MTVISARNLGLRYTIRRMSGNSLRSRLIQLWGKRNRQECFWALRHVSFELADKEVLGVLGCNGSGKSTLCRVLAQILLPDEGRVQVNGRVAPLLALNAGFRQDLTGRENLFLGGALLGLSNARIKELLPEIIGFAELGDFIDNPVGVYSSGMRSRLAFALATSIEPDVLILDEILGVGDSYFKKKSKQRLHQLVKRSRAIVLVSHSSSTIEELCTRALWLHQGRVVSDGPAKEMVARYEHWQQSRSVQEGWDDPIESMRQQRQANRRGELTGPHRRTLTSTSSIPT